MVDVDFLQNAGSQKNGEKGAGIKYRQAWIDASITRGNTCGPGVCRAMRKATGRGRGNHLRGDTLGERTPRYAARESREWESERWWKRVRLLPQKNSLHAGDARDVIYAVEYIYYIHTNPVFCHWYSIRLPALALLVYTLRKYTRKYILQAKYILHIRALEYLQHVGVWKTFKNRSQSLTCSWIRLYIFISIGSL